MQNKPQSQVRIISGKWRGKKLNFKPIDSLRPTGDRIKETLFNWLAPNITGAHCLDLFAGSGALGFEALSRGVATVTFVEKSLSASQQLQKNCAHLGADNGLIHRAEAVTWLATYQPINHFDIVFLDPPFADTLLQSCCDLLEQHKLLAQNACIYVEIGRHQPAPIVPAHWKHHRMKIAGQVSYSLYHTD